MSAPPPIAETTIVKIADALAADGFVIWPHFIPTAQLSTWRARVHALAAANALHAAGIGRQASAAMNAQIRGDFIHWIDATSDDPADQCAIALTNSLMHSLNDALRLSMQEVELHYALYPPGAHYARHVDRHRSSNARVLSFVLYLNETWQATWGGQLQLYTSDQTPLATVQPEGGTLVLFRSEIFPHEVLRSTHNRMSLTGWLRTT